jgi:hypothetical protein
MDGTGEATRNIGDPDLVLRLGGKLLLAHIVPLKLRLFTLTVA